MWKKKKRSEEEKAKAGLNSICSYNLTLSIE